MIVSQVLTNVEMSLRQVLQALDNNLTFEDNFRIAKIELTTPSTMDQEFAVQHLLGRTPLTFIASLDVPGVVYGSRRTAWDKDTLYLKSSASSAKLYLIVL